MIFEIIIYLFAAIGFVVLCCVVWTALSYRLAAPHVDGSIVYNDEGWRIASALSMEIEKNAWFPVPGSNTFRKYDKSHIANLTRPTGRAH